METILPENIKEKWDPIEMSFNNGVIQASSHMTCGDGHFTPDYESVFRIGLLGRVKEAEEEFARTPIYEVGKLNQLKAMIIADKAVIKLFERYAELARKMAAKELDYERKAQLEKIAEVCSHVPKNPAKTFHEALQSLWGVFLCLYYESNGHSISLGRLDQILYPYYKRDVSGSGESGSRSHGFSSWSHS